MQSDYNKNTKDLLKTFIKVIQIIFSIAIPMIMIFTLLVFFSSSFQNYIIPNLNSALSTSDEIWLRTIYPTFFNYLLILIYFIISIGFLLGYRGKKHYPAVILAVVYGLINTKLFLLFSHKLF